MRLPSTQLIQFIQERKLPWLRYAEESGRLEFIIDNYLLSTYRACSAHFMLSAVEGYKRKGPSPWPLDFGTLFHKMMEEYYQSYKKPSFTLESFAIDVALKHWKEMGMDQHLAEPECQQMGGYPGFAGMLVQYATQFKKENENLQVLATEVSFGKAKEVPIYEFHRYTSLEYASGVWSAANIYLSGRMDIIADDGAFIFPVDHKTVGNFYKDPTTWYSIDDGPFGYVYALKHLLRKTEFPPDLLLKRNCSRIMMNFISKKIPKEGSRFKRITLLKSEAALEDYRIRVIGTCNNILNDLELYVRGLGVPRDTSKCSNWYFRECTFADVHRQLDRAGEQATLANGFIKLPLWDTESIQPLYTEEG